MIHLPVSYIMMITVTYYRYILCQLTTKLRKFVVNNINSGMITHHFYLRIISRRFLSINKKGYSDAAYKRDTDGAWCMRDLDQTWWQPIHRMLVVNLHEHGGPLGAEVGSDFESLLSQHVVYEDLFVTINGRSSVLSYLNTKRTMFTVRYYGLEPPIFSPRLVGAERNVFSAEGGHVPNQLRINVMLSCSFWRAVPVIEECRCRIIISFDDTNMITGYQVTSNEKRGLSKTMKKMLGMNYSLS